MRPSFSVRTFSRPFSRIAAVSALVLALGGCGGLQKAAPYDPVIEKTVLEFDKAAMTFIADMQGLAGTPKGTYGENVDFYKKWKVELGHLKNRAISTEVGESCGPDDSLNEVVRGGAPALDAALARGESLIERADEQALQPSLDWARGALDKVRKAASDRGINISDEVLAGDGGEQGRLLAARAERWQNAINRIRGAMAIARREATEPSPETFRTVQGGCTTKMLTYLADQLDAMERFHMKQRDLGIPPRRALVILIGVPVQVILKVQERKRALTERGFL